MSYATACVMDPELAAYYANRVSHQHNHPEEVARYREDHLARCAVNSARHSAKRGRSLGFVPLNSSFAGSEAHHINKQDVIYIPKVMHRSIAHNVFTGRNMDKINALAGKFLTEDWT